MARQRTSLPSGHAQRNLNATVQLSRTRKKKSPVTAADILTRKMHSASRHAAKEQFEKDIDEAWARLQEDIATIAEKHQKAKTRVHTLLCSKTGVKAQRNVTLRNAYVHERAKKCREEGTPKEVKALQEILNEEKDAGEGYDPEGWSDEYKAFLISQLEEHRKVKRQGAHSTEKSAQMDAQATLRDFEDRAQDLFQRTGLRTLIVSSPSHPQDAAVPHLSGSGGASGFFAHQGTTSIEFLREFEHYCHAREGGKLRLKSDISSVRSDISSMMIQKLRNITGIQTAKLQWAGFRRMCLNYRIKLVNVPQAAEALLGKKQPNSWPSEPARLFRDELANGEIRFEKLSEEEYQALAEELAPTTPKRPRKKKTKNTPTQTVSTSTGMEPLPFMLLQNPGTLPSTSASEERSALPFLVVEDPVSPSSWLYSPVTGMELPSLVRMPGLDSRGIPMHGRLADYMGGSNGGFYSGFMSDNDVGPVALLNDTTGSQAGPQRRKPRRDKGTSGRAPYIKRITSKPSIE
ncbi:hypothetical protein C8F01DRAFT_1336399 [Mycena amicta]|nr:hypothetical protein C8F01DRAFT_1336399 [Mycena amicta]